MKNLVILISFITSMHSVVYAQAKSEDLKTLPCVTESLSKALSETFSNAYSMIENGFFIYKAHIYTENLVWDTRVVRIGDLDWEIYKKSEYKDVQDDEIDVVKIKVDVVLEDTNQKMRISYIIESEDTGMFCRVGSLSKISD